MKKLLTIIFLICAFSANSQLNQIPWAADFGTIGGFSNCFRVKVDNQGYVYSLGSFDDRIHAEIGAFDGIITNENPGGIGGMFVSKMSETGDLIWIKPFYAPFAGLGINGAISPTDIEVNELGEIFISGSCGGTVVLDFGFSDSIYYGGSNSFVLKLGSNGELEWLKSWDHNVDIKSIDLLSNNRVIMTGTFSGTVDLNPDSAISNVSANYPTGFSVKIGTQLGSYLSSSTFGEGTEFGGNLSNSSETISNAFDETFIVGFYFDTIHFNTVQGPLDIISVGGTDNFVLKLNPIGQVEWVKSFGGAGFDHASSVNTVGDSKIVITGDIVDTVTFASGTPQGTVFAEGFDAFILVLGNDGAFILGKTIGGSYWQHGFGVASDSLNNIYVVGIYSSEMDCDPGPQLVQHTALEGEEGFILKLDSMGNYLESKSIKGYNYNSLTAVCLDQHNSAYAVGRHFEGIVFEGLNEPNDLPNVDGITTFIIRFGGFTDLNTESKFEASIFPNPAKDFINIHAEQLDVVTLYDAMGKIQFSKKVLQKSMIIDVRDLSSGYYMLKIEAGKNTIRKQVVIN